MSQQPTYLMISPYVSSRRRLADLKARAAKDGSTWQSQRRYGFGAWRAAYGDLDTGRDGDRAIWYTHIGPYFRDEQFADELLDLRHRGWLTNAEGETYKDGSGVARGIVARLPHGRFLVGYWWGDNNERVYYPELYNDTDEAARAADRYAERFAEVVREHDQRWHEARQCEEAEESAVRRLRECLALRHRDCMSYVRAEAHQLVKTIRSRRHQLATEFQGVL